MYTLWVLALSLGVVSADVGLGYHYKVPETSYGVPSYQTDTYNSAADRNTNTGFFGSGSAGPGATAGASNVNTGFTSGSTNTAGYESSYFAPAAGSSTGFNYNTQGTSGTGFNYNGASTANTGTSGSGYHYNGVGPGSTIQGVYQGISGQNVQSGLDGYYQTVGANNVASTGVNYQPSQYPSNQYQSSAVNNYQEYYNQIVQQPAQVFKHFYVHAAPEEPEVPKPRHPIVLPPPQKHYKIIFIKTPAQSAPAPQIIPIQPQNEEKTIVYVLVKKPEDAQNVVIPKVEQKPPTKPEVFFIKYNNKHGSQKVISDIVSGFKEGVSTSFAGVSGPSGDAEVHSSASGVAEVHGIVPSTTSSVGTETFDGVHSTGNQSSDTLGNPGIGVTASTTSSGYQNSFGNLGGGISSTASTGLESSYDASAISTIQGVPYETYGPPKFKQY